jgi:hypothetical protein
VKQGEIIKRNHGGYVFRILYKCGQIMVQIAICLYIYMSLYVIICHYMSINLNQYV